MKDTEDYLKRLKELRGQIEKRSQEKTIEEIYKDVFNLLERVLGKRTQNKMVEEFEKKLIKTGKLSEQSLRILNDVIDARLKFKKGNMNSHKVNEARKNAMILISDLIEYSQREDLASVEKSRIRLKYREGKEDPKEKFADLIIGDNVAFLITGKDIKKIVNKIENSNVQELSQGFESQKSKKNLNLDPRVFNLIREEIGDFEIIF